MTVALEALATEEQNRATADIDQLTPLDIVRRIHQEDAALTAAIAPALEAIAQGATWIAEALAQGGRLFYVGAGTSGRLGILDASECPPTYGTDPEQIQGLIAGGPSAVFRSVEAAEDRPELGEEDLKVKNLTAKDIVVGIAASGRTPYVLGALGYARALGCRTVALSCSPHSPVSAAAELAITVVTGPEVITGSTRMKAGSAQKMVLNMLSTTAMILLGKVYGNLMVDVKASNKKLRQRVLRIVQTATGEAAEAVAASIAAADGHAKTAIVMLLGGVDANKARLALEEAGGFVAKALQKLGQENEKPEN
ncbi:N-acetylmuramic acid 6-phosphate etherase [uncultured Anaeromusa sp.]|uniref:N-acetylmuramic acid 6-phosphate etherase n=1 Tax=uncultured Anaeromusa sp. TaxID=673273 RepID=UPI0029C61614|nr:N-acetylmuramic acid 6-phosphate etherase [uncultured Anaeromusa sp.]